VLSEVYDVALEINCRDNKSPTDVDKEHLLALTLPPLSYGRRSLHIFVGNTNQ
jgi:hypothetical protein